MSREIIHFSHANGFPSLSYKKLFTYLESDYQIGFIDAIGLDANYPVVDNWPSQVAELIDYINQHYAEPIHAVGHSLGAILTYLAAAQRPELFKSITLCEPPMFNVVKSMGMGLLKKFNMLEKVTPGGAVKNRRFQWQNVAQAIEYFKSKALFKHFDAEALEAYVHAGTVESAEGIRLKIDPYIEWQFFNTLPYRFPKLKPSINLPVALMYGEDTDLYNRFDLAAFKRRAHAQVIKLPGGHLFPLEYPELTAKAIKEFIAGISDFPL